MTASPREMNIYALFFVFKRGGLAPESLMPIFSRLALQQRGCADPNLLTAHGSSVLTGAESVHEIFNHAARFIRGGLQSYPELMRDAVWNALAEPSRMAHKTSLEAWLAARALDNPTTAPFSPPRLGIFRI